MNTLVVKDIEIRTKKLNDADYICISDMLKAKDGDFFIADWLRNRNTLEFLGIWEQVFNQAFNYGEFAIIKSHAGLESLNSVFIRDGIPRPERLLKLNQIAISQMKVLREIGKRTLFVHRQSEKKGNME